MSVNSKSWDEGPPFGGLDCILGKQISMQESLGWMEDTRIATDRAKVQWVSS